MEKEITNGLQKISDATKEGMDTDIGRRKYVVNWERPISFIDDGQSKHNTSLEMKDNIGWRIVTDKQRTQVNEFKKIQSLTERENNVMIFGLKEDEQEDEKKVKDVLGHILKNSRHMPNLQTLLILIELVRRK